MSKSNPFIFNFIFFYLFGYIDKKNKRKEGKSEYLADSNESYDIKDLEDDFKGHDIKVFNFAAILEATVDFPLKTS